MEELHDSPFGREAAGGEPQPSGGEQEESSAPWDRMRLPGREREVPSRFSALDHSGSSTQQVHILAAALTQALSGQISV
jgi:hypothetical protein